MPDFTDNSLSDCFGRDSRYCLAKIKKNMNVGIDARLWYESGVGRYIRNIVLGLEEINSPHEFVIFLNEKGYREVNCSSKKFKKILSSYPWHSAAEQVGFKKQIESQ